MEILIPASIMQDFHFLRPVWLLAAIPAILLVGVMWRVNSNVTAWDKAIDKNLLPFLLDRSKNAAQRTPLLMLLLHGFSQLYQWPAPFGKNSPSQFKSVKMR